MRESAAPGHTWMPAPYSRLSCGLRPQRNSPGASNTRGSRLADVQCNVMRPPAGIWRPATSTGQVATRRLVTSGPCRRRISSMASGCRAGSARRVACRSACSASHWARMPTAAEIVPISPTVQLRRMLAMASAPRGWPSTVACMSEAVTSCCGPAPLARRSSSMRATMPSNCAASASSAGRSCASVAAWLRADHSVNSASRSMGQPMNAHWMRTANGSAKAATQSTSRRPCSACNSSAVMRSHTGRKASTRSCVK